MRTRKTIAVGHSVHKMRCEEMSESFPHHFWHITEPSIAITPSTPLFSHETQTFLSTASSCLLLRLKLILFLLFVSLRCELKVKEERSFRRSDNRVAGQVLVIEHQGRVLTILGSGNSPQPPPLPANPFSRMARISSAPRHCHSSVCGSRSSWPLRPSHCGDVQK